MKLVIDGEYIAYHGIVVIYRKRRQHLYLGKTPQKNSDILKNNMMTLLLFTQRVQKLIIEKTSYHYLFIAYFMKENIFYCGITSIAGL